MMHSQTAEKRAQARRDLSDSGGREKITQDAAGKAEGLCTTCVHAATCIFRRAQGRPVLQCNEYQVAETAAGVVDKPDRLHAVERIPERRYQGLCMNCESRTTCMHASTQGGVWHCEEYR